MAVRRWGVAASTLVSFGGQTVGAQLGLESMNLREYNQLRASTDSAPLLTWVALTMALVGSLAQSTTVTVGLVVIFMVLLIFLGRRTIRRLDRVDQFRCPSCGNTPHEWLAPGPSDDRVRTVYDTDFCIHCRFDLRQPEDASA